MSKLSGTRTSPPRRLPPKPPAPKPAAPKPGSSGLGVSSPVGKTTPSTTPSTTTSLQSPVSPVGTSLVPGQSSPQSDQLLGKVPSPGAKRPPIPPRKQPALGADQAQLSSSVTTSTQTPAASRPAIPPRPPGLKPHTATSTTTTTSPTPSVSSTPESSTSSTTQTGGPQPNQSGHTLQEKRERRKAMYLESPPFQNSGTTGLTSAPGQASSSTLSATPPGQSVSSGASSSQVHQVASSSQAAPALAGKPRQDLETLVGDVASGKLPSDSNKIYDQYNKTDNSFQSKTDAQFAKEVNGISYPSNVNPGYFGFNQAKQSYGNGYAQFGNKDHHIVKDTKERVYIHAKADHAPQVMQHVVSQMDNQKYPNNGITGAKIWSPSEIQKRNDGIVVYTNGSEASQKVAQSLSTYQSQNPGHFGKDVPLMTRPHSEQGGFSMGADPNIEKTHRQGLKTEFGKEGFYQTSMGNAYVQGGKPSFGEIRAEMISKAATHPNVRNSDGSINPTKLQQETDRLLTLTNVDPQDPSKNLS